MKRFLEILAVAVLMLVVAAVAARRGRKYLLLLQNVNDPEKPRTVLSLPIAAGDVFRLHYRHSLNYTPVDEIFAVVPGGRMLLREEIFDWDGAGLDFDPRQGEISYEADKRYHIKGINRQLPFFVVAVGTVCDHQLFYAGYRYHLDSLVPPMTHLRFQVVRQDH